MTDTIYGVGLVIMGFFIILTIIMQTIPSIEMLPYMAFVMCIVYFGCIFRVGEKKNDKTKTKEMS